MYASEIGGYTELMFQRPRNTGDDTDDIQFAVRFHLYILGGLDETNGADSATEPS